MFTSFNNINIITIITGSVYYYIFVTIYCGESKQHQPVNLDTFWIEKEKKVYQSPRKD